jgi:hypothetical protein
LFNRSSDLRDCLLTAIEGAAYTADHMLFQMR